MIRKEKIRMMNAVSHDDLRGQFLNLAERINSVLAYEKHILDISPNSDERLSLQTGMKCHYRINSRSQATPMKIHIEMKNGIGFAILFLSCKNQRPGPENNDKKVVLNSSDSLISFKGSSEKERYFSDRYLYFTFIAEREVLLRFTCVFGKGNELNN